MNKTILRTSFENVNVLFANTFLSFPTSSDLLSQLFSPVVSLLLITEHVLCDRHRCNVGDEAWTKHTQNVPVLMKLTF